MFSSIKYLTKGAGLAYSYFKQDSSSGKQLLDPLTTLAKLAILKYKPEDTRLSIHNHKIYFQPYNLLQPAERRLWGDGRGDLHNLCEPLILAYKWYSKNDERIKNIVLIALKGIDDLEITYRKKYKDSDLIIHSLSHYKKILKCMLNGDILEEDYEEDIVLSQKFQELWVDEEITVINDLLILIDKKNKNNKSTDHDIHTLETFLDGKDIEVQMLLKNISVSFSKN
jgi:hypothetical protein